MKERSPTKQPEEMTVAEDLQVLTTEAFGKDFFNEASLIVASSPDPIHNNSLSESERPSMGAEEMWIEFYGKNMKTIFSSILSAVKAGFNVEVHRDWYSDNVFDGSFSFAPPTKFASKKEKLHRRWVHGFSKKRLDILEDEGVKIVPVNVPQSLTKKVGYLFKGRDHKKILFIKGQDRTVAWFGGMNLAQEHFRQLDFMVKFTDPRIVEAFMEEFKKVGVNKRLRNGRIRVTEDTELLVDSGREKSLILEQAIKDIDDAKETIYISSAFLPSGEFLKALVRAKKRGVHIAYITSNPDVAKGLLGIQGKISDARNRRKRKIPVIFPEKAAVHAKALVIDEKIVIFGSHNFKDMPHEELSMRSENPALVKNITQFLEKVTGSNLKTKLKKDFIVPNKPGLIAPKPEVWKPDGKIRPEMVS